MKILTQACLDRIILHSEIVLQINELLDFKWYRKPEGPRRGPWYEAKYKIINKGLWEKSEPCMYFLSEIDGDLKYIGISKNKINDRWRISPGYDHNLSSLGRRFLFHSQCWPYLCNLKSREIFSGFEVSVISASKIFQILESSYCDSNEVRKLKENVGEAILNIESQFISQFRKSIWNVKN